MKIDKIQKRVAVAAIIACSAFAGVASADSADKTQEKIRLMVAAVQARDSGDFKASKQALEELVKIAPKDESVQRMLADVNADIERQTKGEAPVLASKEAVEKIVAEQEAAKAKAEEERIAKEEAAKEAAEKEAEAKAEAEKLAKEEAEKAAEEKAKEVSPVDAAVAEANRKQQLTLIAVFDLVDEAYDAMDEGNWAGAVEKLAMADQKLASYEYSPTSDEARSEVKRAKAVMAKERAKLAMADRDVPNAKKFAAEYATVEEDIEKANDFAEEVKEFEANPYKNRLSDVSPEYAIRVEKANALIDKGRKQYLYGDYMGARATFRQVETLDANNVVAKAYQRLIAEKLQNAGNLTYKATRDEMLDEVSKAWQRPTQYTDDSVGATDQRRDSVVDMKLRNIVIPNVSFPDPGVPLAQAISTLSVLSQDFDKSTEGKKGVNIVLMDAGGEAKNVTLTLRDLPLGQILNWVTQQAGYQYDIENETIVVRKAAEAVASMDTLEFPITQAALTRILGIKAAGGGESSDPFGGGGAAAGGDQNQGEAIKQFFMKAGVDFSNGANLAFDGTKVLVTNSRRNLEKVRNILLRYSEIKQVEIETKFLEVTQGDLKELGFNWDVLHSNMLDHNKVMSSLNRSIRGASSKKTNAGDTPITITTPVGHVDPNLNNAFIQTGQATQAVRMNVPYLPSTINLGADDEYLTTDFQLGTMGNYLFQLKVRALEQKQGSDLLCAPKVTVISGQTASITVSQQMRFPESWGDMQSNVGTSSGDSSGNNGSVTITPGTPSDFTTADVGVVMEVTPNVEEDGSISLTLNPKVTEFEGFLEYGGTGVALSGGVTVTVPSGFIMPVFSVREIHTNVTVFDGATLVMGGLTREEVISVNDQIPVLGDIPWVGRLFQSKGESRQKKNLLIFVTVNRISPGGSVAREQFPGMRAGSVFQNPTIVSPGGAVQRVLSTGSEQQN